MKPCKCAVSTRRCQSRQCTASSCGIEHGDPRWAIGPLLHADYTARERPKPCLRDGLGMAPGCRLRAERPHSYGEARAQHPKRYDVRGQLRKRRPTSNAIREISNFAMPSSPIVQLCGARTESTRWQRWVTMGKARTEHNESALPRAADNNETGIRRQTVPESKCPT